jgi:surface protein
MKKFYAFLIFILSLIYSVSAQDPFITIWKTDNTGTSEDDEITIPTEGSGYDYDVYWEEVGNDSNNGTEINNVGDLTITFPSAGTYRIEISGDFPRIYFNNSGDKLKILSIEQWGDIEWTSMMSAFYGASNLTYNAIDAPDLSGVTSLGLMFYIASDFDGDLSNWDVSTITDMGSMFAYATSFNGNITTWVVSSVTNMSSMFLWASSFDQDIGDWDVSSVSQMQYMFKNAADFDQDISEWVVSDVDYMNEMFREASSFNADISGWNTSQVTTMRGMFRLASEFDQNLGNWQIGNVTDMREMLNSSGLSPANYDATLAGWAGQTVQSDITLNASQLTYCDTDARNTLTSTYGWTITDAGLAFGCEAPELSSPADQTSDVSRSPTLSWEAYTDATHYTLQIRISGDLDPIHQESNITGTSLDIAAAMEEQLQYETTYLWRVMAHSADGDSPWSEEWTFETELPALDAPQLVSPADEAVDVSVTPTLTWNAVPDADEYTVWLSADGDPFAFIEDITGTSTVVPVGMLDFYDEYEWTVVAHSEEGDSPLPGDIRSFRTVGPTVLVSPADVSTDVSANLTFTWEAVAGAENYTLGILDVVEEEAVEYTDITGTSYEVTGLDYSTEYEWTVRAHNGDFNNGNISDGPNTPVWSFTTGDDLTGPSATALSPENGAEGISVPYGTQAVITFDETVKKGNTGTVKLMRKDPEGDVQVFSYAYNNPNWTASGNEASIGIWAQLGTIGDSYYFLIDEGTITDSNDNVFHGYDNSENVWEFRVADVNEPEILWVTRDPENGSTGQPVDIVLEVDFDREIAFGSGTIELRDYDEFTTVLQSFEIGVSEGIETTGNTVRITPATLDYNQTYSVYIPSGAITNIDGVVFDGLTNNSDWYFSTEQVVDIPDENFKTYLVNNTNINTNEDEEIQVSEAEAFTGTINAFSRSISDLTGIEAFPLITGLSVLDNELTSIDVSQNTMLEMLNVGFNSLTTLNVSSNTRLTYLGAYVNSIGSLDVSQNIDLTALEVYDNDLTSIDVSQNENLETLEVQENQLTTLDVSQNLLLEALYCDNNEITSLDLSQSTGLYEIYCHDNLLTELNVANGTNAEGYVEAQNNPGLSCIQVDDENESNLDYWIVDEGVSFSENCSEPEDNEAPTVETFAYRFETDVPVDVGELTITFSEPVVTTTNLNINMWDYSNTLIVQYLGENPSGVSIEGEVVTFTVPQLTHGESYYIQIAGGSFKDLADNNYAGIMGAQHWYFTAESEEEPVVQVNDEDFKTFLLNNAQINTNEDEEIQVSEAENFSGNITYSNQGLSDPTGIEAFINTVWIDLSLNELTSIDLSANVDAAQVNLVGNDLESLVLPDRTSFNNILLNGNQLISLTLPEDITANTIQIYQNPLESFEAANGSFDVINGSGLSSLTSANLTGTDVRVLNLSSSQISTLALGSASSLESIDVSSCGNLTTLDLSANTSLESVTTAFGAVQSLDLSSHPNIITLMARNGQLTELNIQNGTNTNITTFQIQNNSNLVCVQVDDVDYSITNWTNKDAGTQFSTDCSAEEPQDQTITFEVISDKVYGDAPFNLVATATSGLAVSFSIVSGPISLDGNEVTIMGAGTAVIAANQAGNNEYNPAEQVSQTFVIAKADQIITIEPIEDKLTTDASFDVVASVDSELALSYSVSGPATNSGSTITLTGGTGTVTVTVSQVGNGNYNEASESVSFVVTDPTKMDQTITFETIPDKVFGDASFTLEATASSGLDVTFSIVSGPVSLDGNEVTITGAGTAVIAANQAGDDNFNPAPEAQQTFEIAKADQVITIEPIADKLTTDASFDIVASVDSELTLEYDVSGPATNSGATITLTGEAGAVTVTVSQVGNANYNAASESVNFEVTDPEKINQTITFTAIEDKVFGNAPFTLEASASSGLNVTFSIVSGPVSLDGNEVTITGAGTAVIAANQAGDDDFNPAPEEQQTFEIAKADQVITIEPIADKLTTDASFDVVASVDSELALAYEVFGPATNSGATITLTGETGTVTVTVSQAGNGNYNAASASESFDVTDPTKASQTITFDAISDKVFGDAPFTLNANASSGLDVSFSVVSGPVTLDENEVTITGAGTAVIAANQAGNDEYNPAEQVSQTFVIAKADQVITIEPIADKLTTDASFDVVASVDSELTLEYDVSGPATNSGATITLTGETGTVTVTVSQAGNENHQEASQQISFEVSEPEEALSVNENAIKISYYPNPVINHLTIEIQQESVVRLINLDGRVLIVKKLSYGSMDLSSFNPGVYLLEVTTNDVTIRRKIVKAN